METIAIIYWGGLALIFALHLFIAYLLRKNAVLESKIIGIRLEYCSFEIDRMEYTMKMKQFPECRDILMETFMKKAESHSVAIDSLTKDYDPTIG